MEVRYTSPIITEKREYLIDYGAIKRGSDTRVNLDFYGAEYLGYSKSCSCTEPTVTKYDGYFTVTISYDSNKTGTINQYVLIKTSSGDVRIDLKGQII